MKIPPTTVAMASLLYIRGKGYMRPLIVKTPEEFCVIEGHSSSGSSGALSGAPREFVTKIDDAPLAA
jgi:hypothetical protein